MGYVIEISGGEISVSLANGESAVFGNGLADWLDCVKPGDVQEMCEFIRDGRKVEFRVMGRNPITDEIENQAATALDKRLACESIYFDSETDFSDERTAEAYLIWQAASQIEDELQGETELQDGERELKFSGCQIRTLYRKWVQMTPKTSFLEFVKTAQPTFGMDGAIAIHWCNMWLAIERDGYSHT